MKRVVLLTLCLLSVFLLASCKSEEARTVDNMILAIGEVTLDSKVLINDAEKAVLLLSEEDKAQLDHLDVLQQARNDFDQLEAAKNVMEAIDRIGTVTLKSENVIQLAREKYNECSIEIKEMISNYSVLKDAETALSDLKVNNVIILISNIGDVTRDSKNEIEQAKNAVKDLTDTEKKKIPAAKLLELSEAETQFDTIRKEQLATILSDSKFKFEKDDVSNSYWYQPPTLPAYVNTRSYFLPIIDATSTGTPIKLYMLFNYTGDDWVFFDEIYILADNERFIISFDYFDVSRDNQYGTVWERVLKDVETVDINMLRKIASSKEVIVRFSGEHNYDFTMSSADKAAFADALSVYDLSDDLQEAADVVDDVEGFFESWYDEYMYDKFISNLH